LDLLKAADELAFDKIVKQLQQYLINYQEEYLKKDPLGMLEIIFQHEPFVSLRDFCLKIICQDPDMLFQTEKFLTIPTQLLELLLQRDDLALNEIDVWDYLIKWTYAQNPIVELDPSKWTKEEVEVMERTINRLIPLIRFNNISSMNYYEKIFPYEELLPKKLKSDISQFYSVTDAKIPEFDSSIITQKALYLSLFSNWVNKKDQNCKIRNFPQYELKLILRGSEDGFYADSFHEKCDHKGATIVIAKIKRTNQLVGGYNPLDWNGFDHKITTDSFIFFFDDYENLDTGKIGRVIDTESAVGCWPGWGPLFGLNLDGSNDIMVTEDGEWSSVSNSYPDLKIPRYFEIDDYEVFQIVKTE